MTIAAIPDSSQTLVFDRTRERGRLVVSGADRTSWLQGLLTNDIVALRPGMGAYASYLTPQGRMVTDMVVLVHDDEVLVDVPHVSLAEVAAKFELFVIMEDVVVRDATGTLSCLSVHGQAVARVLGLDPKVLPALEHHHVTTTVYGVAATIAASHELGGPGVDLYVAHDHCRIAWAGLVANGGLAAGDEAWEHRRVLAGRPRFGVDMGSQTIPPEAGIEGRAISATKGCYVGQEIIVRMRDIGQGRVAKRLVGLRALGSAKMVAGDMLRRDDRDVGVVTSVTHHPRSGTSIALATVHRDAASEGTELTATDGGRIADVMVVGLPFA